MYSTQIHMGRCSQVGYKNIHVKIKCERSKPEKIENDVSRANSYGLMRANRAGKLVKLKCRE